MIDERQLLEKLRSIERLHAGATTPGERMAAANARERIRRRLEEAARLDPPVEYQFRMADMWSRRLFVALLRRYGIQPYRYRRQRHTTVMARVPKRFLDETLWPEFQELSATLRRYLDEVTERVVSEGVYADSSEAEVVSDSRKQLPGM
jgi:tRNA nucleotidyltransferase (CCA-adding enzyme)